jgi:hypothetical protein
MLFITVVFGLAPAALAVTPATTNVPPLIISGRQSARPAGTYSAGIAEIIKMLDANIDGQIILAYIRNSPIAYNPEATELLALQEHGASTEMLVALLHHGGDLRLQLAQAQAAVNPPPAAPANGYAPEAAYPPYPYDYPDSSYAPYPATDYGYAFGWSVACWPPVGISVYRPYWSPHRPFLAHHGGAGPVGDVAHRNWAFAASPATRAGNWVSAPGSGRTSTFAAHSNGSRGSGHSGGGLGGRSR